MRIDDFELKLIRIIQLLLLVLWFIICSVAVAHCEYTSASNAVRGMCSKYDYYLTYTIQNSEGYYTRSDYYAICYDRFSGVDISDNVLSGNITFISYPYNGLLTISKPSEKEVPDNAINIYSNIPELPYPADNQIVLDSVKESVYQEQKAIFGLALLIGYYITVKCLTGQGLR